MIWNLVLKSNETNICIPEVGLDNRPLRFVEYSQAERAAFDKNMINKEFLEKENLEYIVIKQEK